MKLLLIIAILFTGVHCFAALRPSRVIPDTVIKRLAYALTKDQFLEKYGRDDSSRALVNFFFYKRNKGESMVTGGALLSVLATAGLVVTGHQLNNDYISLGEQISYTVFFIFACGVLAAGIALLSSGTGLWSRYSKKRLLKLLTDYLAGIPVHRGIARNRMFRGYVQYGQWNRDINKKMKTMERNRKVEQRRAR